MDDKQLAMILNALIGLTTEVRRIAVAIETHQDEAEMLSFPLGEFSQFDWANVGMRVVARDDDGPSVIQAGNGKMCKRRSNDKFGTEIWFSYCSGKNDDGTPKYAKVIEFKTIKAPEPLGRKTEAALRSAQPSQPAQNIAQPVAQPASQPASQPVTIAVPIAPSAPIAPSTPVTPSAPPAQPAGPFERWSEIRKRIPAAELPEWLMLAEGDTPAIMDRRIQALTEFAAIPAEAQAKLILLSNEHLALVAKARGMQMVLNAELAVLPPNTRSIEVGAAISTITNLIAAEQRKRNASTAPVVNQTGAPPTPATQPALGQGSARTAEQLREWFAKSVKANAGQRAVDDATRRSVYLALKSVADDQKLHQILAALFGLRSYRDATSAQIYALQAWLKPSAQAKPTNPNAAAEADAVALLLIPTPEVQS